MVRLGRASFSRLDKLFDYAGDLQGGGHARSVVDGPRLGAVGDGPHFVLRITCSLDDAADHVVAADVFADVGSDVQG